MGAVVLDFAQALERELAQARADHARARGVKDREATAAAARRIWAILGRQPRHAWLSRPAGRW